MPTDGAGLLLREGVLNANPQHPGDVVDVRVADGLIVEIAQKLTRRDEFEVDCSGGALLPGLHDHHIHLLAIAAAADSVTCGPPRVNNPAELAAALNAATPRDGWIRGIGYDEAVAGDLDGQLLDRLGPQTPTRIQHRSGALWVVNSAAAQLLGLAEVDVPDGVERDHAGAPTGRLWRLDAWLGERLRREAGVAPNLSGLSAELASYGITGVTDASPDLSPESVRALAGGGLVQRLTLLGADSRNSPGFDHGPFKIVVADHALPALDDLVQTIRNTRPRPVAVHCVTRESLLLTLAAIDEAGMMRGDRIEHAAVAPPEAIRWLAALGLTVVTQPSLPACRGDDYLDRSEPADRDHLWPMHSLLEAGVPVGCSSDAPYGLLNPWQSIAAATRRRTPSGRPISPGEAVDAWTALRGYLTAADAPGGPLRRIAVGERADVAVLDRSLPAALLDPEAVRVRVTIIDGRLVY